MATVRELMTTNCITVTSQNSVLDTSIKMKDNDIGFIPVVEGQKLVGVITDRDIVIRCIAENKQCSSTPVKEVMSEQIAMISPETSVEEAAKLMARQQIRRLPVVENGNLIGVVAIGDMAVDNMHDEKAGKALSGISESERTLAGIR